MGMPQRIDHIYLDFAAMSRLNV